MRDLETAATENFVVHASWASRRHHGATVDSTAELTIVDSGLGTDTFNIVCGARLETSRVAAAAREVRERFAASGRPFSWWVAPGDRPADLASRLEGEGFTNTESELAMAAALPALPLEVGGVAGLTVARAQTPEDLALFATINAENWTPPEAGVLEFYRRSAGDLLGAESPFRFYVARLGETPVAAVEVARAGGVAGVYDLSTRAAHRGRGIASALLAHALRREREEGTTTAVLQAAAAGVGLYRRLGFLQFGPIRELKP